MTTTVAAAVLEAKLRGLGRAIGAPTPPPTLRDRVLAGMRSSTADHPPGEGLVGSLV